MTAKESFRLSFALRISNIFYKKFCWADLVSWAYSSEPFWTFIRLWGHAGGCIYDGKETACYCGKFANEQYFKSDAVHQLIQCPQCKFDWSKQEIETQECLTCGYKVFNPLPF